VLHCTAFAFGESSNSARELNVKKYLLPQKRTHSSECMFESLANMTQEPIAPPIFSICYSPASATLSAFRSTFSCNFDRIEASPAVEMDFDSGAARPRSLIPDSPAIKRQKTASGYNSTSTSANNTGAFNSDDENGDEVVPDTPGHGFLTQPTQILPRNNNPHPLSSSPGTPLDDVQVPVSSPISRNSSVRNVSHAHPARPPSVAGSMAPRGTIFKPPPGVVSEGPTYELISSDEEDTIDRDIHPTKFESAKSSFNGAAPPRNGLESKGTSEFHSILERSKFAGNGVVKKAQTQTLPSRAQPVTPPMDDRHIQKQISQIKLILKDCSNKRAYDALVASNLNANDALDRLMTNQDIIMIESDNNISPPEPAQMKHGLQGRVKSIAEKYSSFPASQMHSSPALPPKPKKRLVQGRKNPSSPAAPQLPLPSEPEEVEAYDSYDSDSAVGSENEEDHQEIEAEVLKYINKCSAKDLVDTTALPVADIEFLIAARPFRSLNVARLVDRAKATKTGKKSNRISVGEKIVEKCVAMFISFDAVKKLQTECAELGKPVGEEMAKWGFDVLGASRSGELEVTSFEETSQLDSGLGTPSSGVTSTDGDDEGAGPVTKRIRRPNFLKQPETMKIDQDEHPGEVFEMKDYQIVGLNWLALMYKLKLSCILADDMGLGKTCQVISFLTHLVETGRTGPHIIVCPGSTLDNWCEEMNRISPKVNFMAYHGKHAELQKRSMMLIHGRQQRKTWRIAGGNQRQHQCCC
jgi:SWI/SNF-related matrix-associated actin-dependent regulator 1 of chromatin subfamily A